MTGQRPYTVTLLGRGALQPSAVQTRSASTIRPCTVVDAFYRDIRAVGAAILLRQARETPLSARHPDVVSDPGNWCSRLTASTLLNTI